MERSVTNESPVTIPVLDKGYMRLEQWMGDDLAAVNAARASYAKRTDSMSEKDKKLLRYLILHDHLSPFRHAALSVEIKAPLMVMNQWWKHVVGVQQGEAWMGHNEMSRRYVTEEPEFYIPSVWRAAPENSKQGSGGAVDDETNETIGDIFSMHIESSLADYNDALKDGVCAEQARLFLPAYALYTKAWSTFSLQAALFLIHQRLDPHSQWEIRQYAGALHDLVQSRFPLSLQYWREHALID